MQSSGYRFISGIVVTLLLIAFVTLIVFTLSRPTDPAQTNSDQPTAHVGLVSTVPAEGTGLIEPAPATDAVSTPDPAQEPAQPLTQTVTASAGEVVTETVATDAPEIAITLQPTPTRSTAEEAVAETSEQVAVVEETPTAQMPLVPTVDPAGAPQEPLLVYANRNWVNDVVWEERTLWSATSGGALRWNVDSGSADYFGLAQGLGSTQLTSVARCALDGFGMEGSGIVFGSNGGLQLYATGAGTWTPVVAEEDGLPFNEITAIACNDSAGMLAVGSAAGTVAILTQDSGEWMLVETGEEEFTTAIRALAIDDEGIVWVASGGTVAQVEDAEISALFTSENSPLTGEMVTALASDGSTGNLWLTAGERLYKRTGSIWDVFRADSSGEGGFPEGTLVDVLPAQGGRAWIAAQGAEICRFDPEFSTCAPFYTPEDNPDEERSAGPVTALALGSSGDLAYATAGSGASAYTRNRWRSLVQEIAFPAGNRIFALTSDTNGFVWTASNGGVQQVDPGAPQDARIYTAAQDGVSATNVRSLYADARGGVWLGGIGASYFDGLRWTNYTQADGLAGDEITAITQDGQTRVWFGTRTGLSIWTGTTFFNLTAENSLPDAEILALAADGDGVWIGSAAGGLYRFENNQLQVLTQENVGLPSNRITALLIAPAGDGSTVLFVGTDRGIVRFQDGTFHAIESIPEGVITSLAAGLDGTLWVGTAADGAWYLPAGSAVDDDWQPAQTDDDTLAQTALPQSVRALTVDLFGGAWLGTDNGGIVRFAP